jgi:hypothetical protein
MPHPSNIPITLTMTRSQWSELIAFARKSLGMKRYGFAGARLSEVAVTLAAAHQALDRVTATQSQIAEEDAEGGQIAATLSWWDWRLIEDALRRLERSKEKLPPDMAAIDRDAAALSLGRLSGLLAHHAQPGTPIGDMLEAAARYEKVQRELAKLDLRTRELQQQRAELLKTLEK